MSLTKLRSLCNPEKMLDLLPLLLEMGVSFDSARDNENEIAALVMFVVHLVEKICGVISDADHSKHMTAQEVSDLVRSKIYFAMQSTVVEHKNYFNA